MPAIGQQQILGALVPDISIDKITLESAPTVQKRRRSDRISAHVQENKVDGTSLEFIEGYQNIHADPEKNLTVTLSMSIKDRLDNGSITTWFNNQNIHEFLHVTVVQSIDPFTSKLLSASNNAIQIANFSSGQDQGWEQPGGMKEKIMSMLIDISGDPEFKDFQNKFGIDASLNGAQSEAVFEWMNSFMTTKGMTFSQIAAQNDIGDLMDSQYSDENTNSFDVPFQLQFELQGTPQHLSYFAVVAFSPSAIQNKYGVHMDDPFFIDMMTGNTVGELVINGSRVIDQSYIYRMIDGTIYTGPVEHINDSWWWVGANTATDEPLTRDLYPHSKVQDFRVLERLKDMRFAFTEAQANLMDSVGKYKTPHSEKISWDLQKIYFSNFAITTTPNHNLKFAFSMDYGSLVRDNTKFSKLFKIPKSGWTADTLKELMSAVEIANMTILRRRVSNEYQGLNALGSPADLRNIFNEAEQVPVVIASGRDVSGKLEEVPSPIGLIKESKIQTAGDTPLHAIRHFEAADNTMSTVTDGHYQYGVELEIKDNTHKKIANLLQDLLVHKAEFDKYALAASVPTTGTKGSDASSVTTRSGYGLSASQTLEKRTLGVFDPVRNRFTDKFIKEQEALYKTPTVFISDKPWEMAPFAYFVFLSLISGGTDLDISGNTIEQLVKSIAPDTGTPQGISLFQKLMDDLVSKVEGYIKSQMAESSNKTGATKAAMPLAPSHRTFKIAHWFGETWDSNLPKVGYDYLSEGTIDVTDPTQGLKNIPLNQYENVVNAETTKHWKSLGEQLEVTKGGKSINTGDNLDATKWEYLTPSNVDLGDNGGCFQTDPVSSEKNAMMKSAIQKLNQTKQSPFLPIMPFLDIKPILKSVGKRAETRETATGNHSAANLLMTKVNVADILANTVNLTVHVPDIIATGTGAKSLLEGITNRAADDPWVDATKNLGDAYDFVDPIDPTKVRKQSPVIYEEDAIVLLEELVSDTLDLADVGLKNKPQAVVNKDILEKKFRFYDHSFYNLNNGFNAINKKVSEILTKGSVIPASDGGLPPQIQNEFIKMPNQIKSLFIGSLKPDVVNYDMSANNGAYFSNPINHATIIFNYKMIRKVEVLTGYKVDETGAPMLKQPIWTALGDAVLQKMKGKDILCRHTKYTDRSLGIEMPSSMKLPVYDRYFTISVPAGDKKKKKPAASTQQVIKKAIQNILTQNKNIPVKHLHTIDVSMKNVEQSLEHKAIIQEHKWK